MKVLLAEDDHELARQISVDLSGEGHQVRIEDTGPGALEAGLNNQWDIVILDVSLPGLGGFEVLEQLRAAEIRTPVIFVTARGEVVDRVRGLMLGGDDYLTKPFSKDELRARLHALARRSGNLAVPPPVEPPLPAGWRLNHLLRQVIIDDAAVSLQPREWSLLQVFLNNEGEVLTKSFLLDRVWGIRFDPGTNVVDAVVCRLRSKLSRSGKPSYLKTCRGRGYVFQRDV